MQHAFDQCLANAQAREIDEKIAAAEAARQRATPRLAPRRDVTIALEAGAATKATVQLTYNVSGASWKASYDARLDTSASATKPAFEFVRRAAVAQRTGEDWSDVTLAVSTVRTRGGAQAQDVETQKLAFVDDQPVEILRGRKKKAARFQAESDVAARAGAPAAAPAPAPAPMLQAEESQASVEAGAFQASFRIPGRVTVASGGATKTLRIAGAAPSPTLSARAAPSLEEAAYLTARFTLDEEAPLLPGEVNLFRDGAFAGTTSLKLIPPGEPVDLGFGVDDRVKITRAPVKRKENEPTWFGQTKIDARDFRTVVKNLHTFPIKVAVTDRVPISENAAIVVETLPQTTAPTEKQVGDKRGVMGWTFDLAPGETKELRLAWRVKWPAEREIETVDGGR